jgi:thiamine pyrophosphate-dependent acetolactate synthase large subunit-like protein
MPDFGSLGLSLAAAVGASIACPERRTVAILGDGGLMMSLSELDTIKRTGAPDLIVVLNDGVYGAEYPHLAEIGASLGPATFASASPSDIARAVGIPAIRLREGDDLGALDGVVAARGGPTLVEVICPPPATKHG